MQKKSQFKHKYDIKGKGVWTEGKGRSHQKGTAQGDHRDVSEENDTDVGRCHNETNCSYVPVQTVLKIENKKCSWKKHTVRSLFISLNWVASL